MLSLPFCSRSLHRRNVGAKHSVPHRRNYQKWREQLCVSSRPERHVRWIPPVISQTSKQFRKLLRELPPQVQKQAREAYLLWLRNPAHASLRFKQIHATEPIFSARISLGYRAVAFASAKL